MNKITQVLPVKEFNALALARWHRASDEWASKGRNGGMPFVGFYVFYTERGNERQTGYIASYTLGDSDRLGHVWGKTKKEAIERANQ